jgi:hypothetical protein
MLYNNQQYLFTFLIYIYYPIQLHPINFIIDHAYGTTTLHLVCGSFPATASAFLWSQCM